MVGAKKETWPGDKLSGKKRIFEVTLSKTVEITLDENVIKQGLLPGGPIFGPGATEREVLEHLLFNLAGNGLCLSMIDGYANCPDAGAEVPDEPFDVESILEMPRGK